MKPVLTIHNQHLFNCTITALHDEQPPSQRLGKRAGEFATETVHNEQNPWYESPEEIKAGLEYGAQKRAMLARVDQAMRDVLTTEERVTMELRFTYALTYREIADIMDRNTSTIHRRIEKCIWKIKRRIAEGD